MRLALAALLLLGAGCDLVDRPNRAVPEGFVVTALDGTVIDELELKGHPWVINFWLPL